MTNATTASKAALITTHLAASAIIVPALRRHLAQKES